MPTPLTDADKVLRNDTGIDIATNIASIASALTPSNITDLGDVNLTNPITDGQVIKYDTATQKWVNGLGNITMECTQAQYDAWKQSGQLKTNTLYVITDAPNLNETAKQISYDGGTDTVWDKVEAVNSKYKDYIYEGTNVAVTTSYSSGAMYYANISLPDLDSDKLISVTLTDYGGLSNVLMFQITSKNSFRVWSKTSQTLTTLKARLFYVKSTS